MTNQDFLGRTALVTGASIGIGKATAQQFAKRGANVVIVDVNTDGLEALKEELLAYGHEVLAYTCDVSDEARVREVAADALAHFGKIEILVNNAALWRRHMPFVDTNSDMWKKFIDVNILGTLYFTHALLPNMLENHYGRIINIGSVAGVYGNANMADYSLTKGAIISFTKALAKEVTDKGILVNCVSPGSVSNKQDVTEPSELSFMGRSGNHTENANLICFLASDEASYISCQNIQVDGCRKRM